MIVVLHVLLAVTFLGSALALVVTANAKADASGCPAVVMSGNAAVLRAHVEEIRATDDDEERADLMVEFRHCIKERGIAALSDRRSVMALVTLLDDSAVDVQAAYLLGDIGPAARPALPTMKALLAAQPDPADVNGFVFNRDAKLIGALENAIAQIERLR